MKTIITQQEMILETSDGRRFFVTASYDTEFGQWSASAELSSDGHESAEAALKLLGFTAADFAAVVKQATQPHLQPVESVEAEPALLESVLTRIADFSEGKKP